MVAKVPVEPHMILDTHLFTLSSEGGVEERRRGGDQVHDERNSCQNANDFDMSCSSRLQQKQMPHNITKYDNNSHIPASTCSRRFTLSTICNCCTHEVVPLDIQQISQDRTLLIPCEHTLVYSPNGDVRLACIIPPPVGRQQSTSTPSPHCTDAPPPDPRSRE